jgi:hypothetical protein
MKRGSRKGWRWRVADQEANRDLNLLYEPGNWGDVIKGMWATVTASALAQGDTERPFLYLDPFAGAPTYPLVEAASRRLAEVPAGQFRRLQDVYARSGSMASTALLVRDAARAAAGDFRMEVYDTDDARREAWAAIAEARILPGPSGEAVVEALENLEEAPRLILIDPYDFFVRWSFFLPHVLAAARRSVVLVYSYNRAPRGPGQQRMYGDLRRALAAGLPRGEEALIGRVPADATVARAYHEMMLLGAPAFLRALREELSAVTRDLATAIVSGGAFEVIEAAENAGKARS